MDRGFAGLDYLKQLQAQNQLFVIRLSTNYKLAQSEDDEWRVGTGKKPGIYRVVGVCDLETKVEYRMVTNLPATISNEEVARFIVNIGRLSYFGNFSRCI